MDGRRFGRAPKSAAFSRGGRLRMAGLMSEAALWLLDYARCTRNRSLGRAFPVRIVNGFHPPKVANLIRWMRGGGLENSLYVYALSLRMRETLRAQILRAVGRYVCTQKSPGRCPRQGSVLRFGGGPRPGYILFLCVGLDRGLNALGSAGGPD